MTRKQLVALETMKDWVAMQYEMFQMSLTHGGMKPVTQCITEQTSDDEDGNPRFLVSMIYYKENFDTSYVIERLNHRKGELKMKMVLCKEYHFVWVNDRWMISI